MAIGWKQFNITGIAITPQRYTRTLQWQIGRKLVPTRLATALTEDSGRKVSIETAGKVLKKYPPKKWSPPKRVGR